MSDDIPENPHYLTEQLITYIGNKRALLDFIGTGLDRIRVRLGRRKLSCFDVFSGSGAVSRYLKRHSTLLVANDLELYADVISRCYLANREEIDEAALRRLHAELSARLAAGPLLPGLVSELYAPVDDDDIKPGERAFYTTRNARFIDTARTLISGVPDSLAPFFLAPLLAEASVHANTAGVFKGFYKDSRTGVGRFGGKQGDALSRIRGDIALPYPVFSNFSCETLLLSGDAAAVAETAPEVDVAYLDPPYNQHPYGSNYFMLNLIADYRRPNAVSPVSGIPADWNRSPYNRRREAAGALVSLTERLRAKFLLVSFNSEGFIGPEEMSGILGRLGRVEVLETPYNAFRGSRNLGGRGLHLTEYLYLVEKK